MTYREFYSIDVFLVEDPETSEIHNKFQKFQKVIKVINNWTTQSFIFFKIKIEIHKLYKVGKILKKLKHLLQKKNKSPTNKT